MFNVWLAFEDKGLALHKAHDWWRQHCGENFPKTVDEAYSRFRECRTATHIRVDSSGKYPEILDYLF